MHLPPSLQKDMQLKTELYSLWYIVSTYLSEYLYTVSEALTSMTWVQQNLEDHHLFMAL